LSTQAVQPIFLTGFRDETAERAVSARLAKLPKAYSPIDTLRKLPVTA